MGNMTREEQSRLDRIEEKIDKLSEAIISIARAEEKIVNLEKNVNTAISQLVDMDTRMRTVEKKADDSEGKFRNLSSFLWLIIAGFVTSIITMLFGK